MPKQEERIFVIEIDSPSVGLYEADLVELLKELKKRHKYTIKSIKISSWTYWRNQKI